MPSKNFQDLVEEVHEKGICQECGGCVSFCSSVDYNVIDFIEGCSHPVYVNKDKCLECGICYYICPQTHILDEDLNQTYKFTEFNNILLGYFESINSCQATDEDFLKHGSDGGVVNSIINYLLEKKIIDGAIVSKTKAPFSRKAMFAENKADLIATSGTILDVSSQLDEIQKFSTYTRTIPKLNRYKFKKLAIVGTPCQIYTIRCMQNLGVMPSENIELCLGLFCYENFNFDKLKLDKFEEELGIKFEDIEKINVKEDLILKVRDNGRHKLVHIPFDQLNDYMRLACNACNDFTNIYADISFGGLGSRENFTTVIPRTEKGKKIFTNAINERVIKCLEIDLDEKNKMKELLMKYSQSKLDRKENYMKNLL
jgi:coenzyme F420 hydrogenase subunit beta